MAYCLDIPHWHPARLNQLCHGHWSKGHRLKKNDRHFVMVYAHQQKIPLAVTKRSVLLTLVLRPGQRRADPDAFFKSSLDALVHAGILVNDSPDWVELLPVRYERGTVRRWGTRITLEDL